MEASPLRSGILILPITTTEAFTGITAGILIHRTGRYLELIYVGVILMTLGNGLYILFSATTSIGCIIGFQIVTGLGQGLLFEAPLIALQVLVPQGDVASASATFGFIRNLATSLAVVIGGVIFQNSMDMQVALLAQPPVNLPSNITDALSGGKAAANVLIVATIEDQVQRLAVREAFAWSMRNMWITFTCIAVLGVVASLFIKREVLSKVHVETKTGIKEMDAKAAGVST